jgi:hypothetical protein
VIQSNPKEATGIHGALDNKAKPDSEACDDALNKQGYASQEHYPLWTLELG